MSDAKPEPTADPSEEIVDKPRRGRGGCAIGCLFVALPVYFLSPPLAYLALYRLADWGWIPMVESRAFVDFFYIPIDWLEERVDAVRAFYDWYFGLFEAWFYR